jgi:hypothetical protein
MRRVGLTLITLILPAGRLAAQGIGIPKGTIEVGVFGRENSVSTTFSLADGSSRTGLGGRLGFFAAKDLALELDVSNNPFRILPPSGCAAPNTSCPLSYIPIRVQLAYNAPINQQFYFLVGAGVSDQHLSGPVQNNKLGVGGTAGVRWRVSPVVGLRLDATIDVLPKGTFDVLNTYTGEQLGIDLLARGKRCDHSQDAVVIHPTSARISPRQTQPFSGTAMYCGGVDDVTYRLTGPGMLDSVTGVYSATVPGVAHVVAYSRRGRRTAAADVTVTTTAPVTPPPPPPPPAPAPLATIAITGPVRVKAGVPYGYTAQPRRSDGTPVARAVTWTIVSGSATIDASGKVVTSGAGKVVLQARTDNVTGTYSVTSYDWTPFRNGAMVGTALESANLDSNLVQQSEYPTLVIGCGSGAFVLGLVTQDFITAGGAVSYRFDDSAATREAWLETPPEFHGYSYFGGSNGARKAFAGRIAASRVFVIGFKEYSGSDHDAAFTVAGMTAAIAPVIAACPVDGPRGRVMSARDSVTAIDALLKVWKQVPDH